MRRMLTVQCPNSRLSSKIVTQARPKANTNINVEIRWTKYIGSIHLAIAQPPKYSEIRNDTKEALPPFVNNRLLYHLNEWVMDKGEHRVISIHFLVEFRSISRPYEKYGQRKMFVMENRLANCFHQTCEKQINEFIVIILRYCEYSQWQEMKTRALGYIDVWSTREIMCGIHTVEEW